MSFRWTLACQLVASCVLAVPSRSPAQFPASFDLSRLNGSNGFVVTGLTNGLSFGVSGAGDVNGDGIDDLLIGAPNIGTGGASYVVFGSRNSFSSSLDLSTLDGSNGFVLNGIDQSNRSGVSVSGAGDVNGDGVDDLLIGAGSSGERYVVFGSSQGFAASFDLSRLNGSNGFVLRGEGSSSFRGGAVDGVGDFNGDGFDDLLIGASSADPNGDSRAGVSYVVFGQSSGFSASLDLNTLNGSNGFAINGVDRLDSSGTAVSRAGDVNGDGVDDLLIGAPLASPNGNARAGESYVVFGSKGKFTASFDLSTLNGSNGFVINGVDSLDRVGGFLSGAGDINGDGVDDLIFGAPDADPNGILDAGASYVVFGQSGGFPASLDLNTLNGSNGFTLDGVGFDDGSGSVSGAGDINGDGLDDLLIGASGADPNGVSRAGESYLVFGRTGGFATTLDLSALDGTNGFIINGVDPGDSSGASVSDAGDVNGDGIDDLIIGAPFGGEAGRSYVIFGQRLIPEPSSLAIAAGGLLGWLVHRRRG